MDLYVKCLLHYNVPLVIIYLAYAAMAFTVVRLIMYGMALFKAIMGDNAGETAELAEPDEVIAELNENDDNAAEKKQHLPNRRNG